MVEEWYSGDSVYVRSAQRGYHLGAAKVGVEFVLRRNLSADFSLRITQRLNDDVHLLTEQEKLLSLGQDTSSCKI